MSEADKSPMQLAFERALATKGNGVGATILTAIDGNLKVASSNHLVVLDEESLLDHEGKAQVVGCRWSEYISGRRQNPMDLKRIQVNFAAIASTVSKIHLNQGAYLYKEVSEGMGVYLPKNSRIFTRTVLGLMDKRPELFRELSIIPGWINLHISTYYIIGFVMMLGYNEAQRRQLYQHIAGIQQLPKDEDIRSASLCHALADWTQNEFPS